MDNITHSLVGAAIAQGAIQYRLYRHARRQSSDKATSANAVDGFHERVDAAGIAALPMFMTSIMANNFPDADLLITAFMDPRLGYILHHRGHTHTLLFVPMQLLMILGILWLYQRFRARKGDAVSWSREDWRYFVGLAVVGGCVHLGMDSWNVYGVHPFWPLNNQWYYGDFVFILEPLFWIVLIPWLRPSLRERWSRNTLLVLYTLGFVAMFVVYFRFWWYPLGVAIAMLSFGAWVRSRNSMVTRGFASFLVLFMVLGSLLGSSLWLRGTLRDALHRQAPSEKVRDIALMSYPSNPFCYQWISMAYDAKTDLYVLRKGIFSFSPKWFVCPKLTEGTTARLQKAKVSFAPSFGGLMGAQEVFRRPLKELKSLSGHCQLEAALQFIRTPFWEISRRSFLVGDLRFDRRKAFDLADFRFARKPKKCPVPLPPWVSPLRSRGLW